MDKVRGENSGPTGMTRESAKLKKLPVKVYPVKDRLFPASSLKTPVADIALEMLDEGTVPTASLHVSPATPPEP